MSEDADFYSLNMECEHHNSKEDCYECAIASIRARWPQIDETLKTLKTDNEDYLLCAQCGIYPVKDKTITACPKCGLFPFSDKTIESLGLRSTGMRNKQATNTNLGRIESMTSEDLQFLRDCGISTEEKA